MDRWLTMTVGLPGSGKSHWIQEFINCDPSQFVVCSDDLRIMSRAGEYAHFKHMEPTIKTISREAIGVAFQNGMNVVLDECLIKRVMRESVKRYLHYLEGVKFRGVYFPTPIDVCIERRENDTKGSYVDFKEIIISMSKDFEPPTADEFDEFIVVEQK